MEIFCVLTVSMSTQWLRFCSRVLQDITIERNWVRCTWTSALFLMFTGDSMIISIRKKERSLYRTIGELWTTTGLCNVMMALCFSFKRLVYSYKTHIEISTDEMMYLEFASEQSRVGDKEVRVSWESEKAWIDHCWSWVRSAWDFLTSYIICGHPAWSCGN